MVGNFQSENIRENNFLILCLFGMAIESKEDGHKGCGEIVVVLKPSFENVFLQ